MKRRTFVFALFLVFLYIGPMIFTQSFGPSTYLTEQNIAKDFLTSNGDWYAELWHYRKSISINGSSGAGTNYSVRISVTYDSDMQTDFDDVLFTDDDGLTPLDFWLETYTASTSAAFWVNVRDDLGTDQDIYMYYGNPAAGTTSSGDDTFFDFNDVEEGTTADWSGTGGTGYAHSASTTQKHTGTYSSRITVNPAGSGGYFYETVTAYQGYGYAFGGFVYDDGDNQANNEAGMRLINVGSQLYVISRDYSQSTGYYVYYDGSFHVTAVARSTAWHRFEIGVVDATHNYATIDGTAIATLSAYDMNLVNQLRLTCYRKPTYVYGDDFYVRKYVNPEPIVDAFGEEETNLPLIWHLIDDAPLQIIIRIPAESLWALNNLYILLGAGLVIGCGLYLVKGGKNEVSMNKVYYVIVAFMIGWALIIGGVMP